MKNKKFDYVKDLISKAYKNMESTLKESIEKYPNNEFIKGHAEGYIQGMEYILECIKEYGEFFDLVIEGLDDETKK